MLKMIILIKKKKGMSRDDFIAYYEANHSPLGKRLVGHLWTRYTRNYPKQLMAYNEATEMDGYDAITEIWFKDQTAVDEMARIVNIPENNAAILRDEENFQEREHTRMLMVEEYENGTTV